MDTVSVVMPVYNAEPYLASAIDSVLQQTHGSWELFIVDDGSTDGSIEVAAAFERSSPAVHLLTHSDHKNHGVSAARNLALHQCRGKYVAFLDADDAWLPQKLERQLAVFDQYPSVGVVFSRAISIGADGQKLAAPTGAYGVHGEVGHGIGSAVNVPFEAYESFVMDQVFAPTPTVIVRRNILNSAGGFPLGLKSQCEDHVMWTRIAASCEFYFMDEALALYRIHPASWTSRQDYLSVIDTYREYLLRLNHEGGLTEPIARGLCRLIRLYWQAKKTPFPIRAGRVVDVLRRFYRQPIFRSAALDVALRRVHARRHGFIWL